MFRISTLFPQPRPRVARRQGSIATNLFYDWNIMPIRQVYSQLLRAAAKLIKDQLADIFALLFLVKYVGKSR